MPTATEAGFWTALGNPSRNVREFLSDRGYLREYLSGAADEREETVQDARELIASLNAHGLGVQATEALEASDASDQRWRLLWDLGKRWAEIAGAPEPVEPLRFRCGLDWDALGQTPRVTFDFDSRVSMRAAIAGLREMWPLMVKAGWIRRTRPLGDRKLALLRFVCLESEPGLSWRERLAAWNRNHYGDWRYEDAQAFQGDFTRGEESLTGRKGGLARFYNIERRQECLPKPLDTRTGEQIIAATIASDSSRRVRPHGRGGGHDGNA